MNYLSLPINVLLSPGHLQVPKALRATWHTLLAQCAFHESGGVLIDAKNWGKREWDRCAATNFREISELISVGLARWEGSDLLISHYPEGQEHVQKSRRTSGEVGGRVSGEVRRRKSQENSGSTASTGASDGASAGASNGRVGKVEVGRVGVGSGEGEASQPVLPGVPDPEPDPEPPRSKKPLQVARFQVEAARLWDQQETLRTAAIPGTMRRPATAERLEPIVARLEAGATPAECEHVLLVRAAEAKRRGHGSDAVKYFNGQTNWRKDNFAFALGQPRPSDAQLEAARAPAPTNQHPNWAKGFPPTPGLEDVDPEKIPAHLLGADLQPHQRDEVRRVARGEVFW